MAFPNHIQVALKMLPHLVERANKGETITSVELGDLIGTHQTLKRSLTFIREYICQDRLPSLDAIVILKTDTADKTQVALKSELRQQVYQYGEWDVALQRILVLYSVIQA